MFSLFNFVFDIQHFFKGVDWKALKPELKKFVNKIDEIFEGQKLTPELVQILTDLILIIKKLGGIKEVHKILKKLAETKK